MASRSRRLWLLAGLALLLAAVPACGGGPSDDPAGASSGRARHGFQGVSASNPAVKVWAVGDGASGSEASRAVGRLIARDEPDLVLYTGDVYEHGTAREFEANVFGAYRALLPRMLPTPGNHDWPNHATGYDPFWKSVIDARTPPYYAVRAGSWKILSLNSEIDMAPTGAQVEWYRRQTRGGGTCRLAFWHRPRFSAGQHGDQPDVEPLWQASRGRVALVVNGHDHDLQRFGLYQGIVEMVSGAGGKDHYAIDPDDQRPQFSDDEVDGAIRFVLRPDRADYRFVASSGRVLDRGSVPCRR